MINIDTISVKIFTILSFIVLFIQSCVTFDAGLINPNPLNKNNLRSLNGKYECIPVEHISSKYRSKSNRFFKEIDRSLFRDTLAFDSISSYQFELEVIDPKRMKIRYLKDNIVFRERILKAKLSDDGYVYLKNKNYGFLLIPYIFGIIDINKLRITKSVNNNLILDTSNHRSGAAFLIIYLHWYNEEYRSKYYKE